MNSEDVKYIDRCKRAQEAFIKDTQKYVEYLAEIKIKCLKGYFISSSGVEPVYIEGFKEIEDYVLSQIEKVRSQVSIDFRINIG